MFKIFGTIIGTGAVGIGWLLAKKMSVTNAKCSKWQEARTPWEKFDMKHLLNEYGPLVTEADAGQWTRKEWRSKLRYLVDLHVPKHLNPRDYKGSTYGKEKAFSVILERSTPFLKPFNHIYDKAGIEQFKAAVSRDKKWCSPERQFHGDDMLFVPDQKTFMHARVRDDGEYDIYIMNDMFIMVGTIEAGVKSGVSPMHFECAILPQTSHLLNSKFVTLELSRSKMVLGQRYLHRKIKLHPSSAHPTEKK